MGHSGTIGSKEGGKKFNQKKKWELLLLGHWGRGVLKKILAMVQIYALTCIATDEEIKEFFKHVELTLERGRGIIYDCSRRLECKNRQRHTNI